MWGEKEVKREEEGGGGRRRRGGGGRERGEEENGSAGGVGGGRGVEERGLTSSMVENLDPATQAEVLNGFANALRPIFLVGAVVAAVACLASTRLVELPLGPMTSAAGRTPAE